MAGVPLVDFAQALTDVGALPAIHSAAANGAGMGLEASPTTAIPSQATRCSSRLE
jgi:hypothetical protein